LLYERLIPQLVFRINACDRNPVDDTMFESTPLLFWPKTTKNCLTTITVACPRLWCYGTIKEEVKDRRAYILENGRRLWGGVLRAPPQSVGAALLNLFPLLHLFVLVFCLRCTLYFCLVLRPWPSHGREPRGRRGAEEEFVLKFVIQYSDTVIFCYLVLR